MMTVSSTPMQPYTAASPMIQARSRFCILNKKRNGSSATNMNAQLYSSATPVTR